MNSIIAKACDALALEIADAQALLTQMRNHDSKGLKTTTPAAKQNTARKNVAKKNAPNKNSGKAWTPEHRANYMRSMKKLSAAKAKAAQ